ncbi:MAG: glycosyltransferase family 2 protein [Pseudomonadota bacterium]
MERVVKLIVQIPCYNEADTLAEVIAAVPRDIPGIASVEVLIVDDGSTDGTAEIAQSAGADHIIQNRSNMGLARTFERGIEASLRAGADIIVNTDGDHQYPGTAIPELIAPILQGIADVVVGDRNAGQNKEFSATKRFLQRLGSSVVRQLSGVDVSDAVSGFRAYRREAALGINVLSSFSYTTETLIQLGRRGLSVASVPVATNAATRPSRLSTSTTKFVALQMLTIIRSYMLYRPLRALGTFAAVLMVLGILPIVRFVYFFSIGEGGGHIQSLVLGSMFFLMGFTTFVAALLSDIIAGNRMLLERTLERQRRADVDADEPG